MNLFREPSHFIVLVLLVAVLFGWKRLPDMARSVGRSMRIFKSEVSEMKNDGTQPKPSPAASDTVAGGVVTPASPAAGAAPEPPAAQPQPAQPQPAPPQPAEPRDPIRGEPSL